jgi:hypothetical protein
MAGRTVLRSDEAMASADEALPEHEASRASGSTFETRASPSARPLAAG